MRVATKEIRWHETRPIFSCDFQPFQAEVKLAHVKGSHPYARPEGETSAGAAGAEKEKQWRLATAGGDNHIRMWLVTPLPNAAQSKPVPSASAAAKDAHAPRVEYLATLSRHAAVVNVVRFSPTGQTLASAGDDGTLILWYLSDEVPKTGFADEANEAQFASEVWKIRRSLRSTGAEIYDLGWSPDGQWLVVGSTDNTARIVRASTGDTVAQITDHSNYVQGVAWDPLYEYIATQSSDRHMHMYQINVRQHGNTPELTFKLVGKNMKMDVQHEKPEVSAGSLSSNNKKQQQQQQQPPPSPMQDDDIEIVGSNGSDTFKRPEPKRASSSKASVEPERHDHALSSKSATDREGSSSRRSSVSSVHDSPASHSSARHARSPSPMPPLPAIKMPVPTSPGMSATATSPRVPALELDAASAASTPTHQRTVHDPQLNKVIRSQQLYGGSEVSPFFRRLAWSTDGSLLLTPAGQFDDPFVIDEKAKEREREATASASTGKKKSSQKSEMPQTPHAVAANVAEKKGSKPTVFIYARGSITKPPIAHLPGHKTHSIAIRFNPLLWELRRPFKSGNPAETHKVDLAAGQSSAVTISEMEDSKAEPIKGNFALPYRMIYAIATHESVYVYDTQQAGPICMFGNLHYAAFTDLAWTADGQSLVLASQDGYCSVVAFEPEELGNPLPTEQQMKARQSAAGGDQTPSNAAAVLPSSPTVASVPPATNTLQPRPKAAAQGPPSAPASTTPTELQATPGASSAEDGQPPKKKARRVALTSHGPTDAPQDGPL